MDYAMKVIGISFGLLFVAILIEELRGRGE